MQYETVVRFFTVNHILGFKDATGNIELGQALIVALPEESLCSSAQSIGMHHCI